MDTMIQQHEISISVILFLVTSATKVMLDY